MIASARGAVPASLECIFFDGYIFNDGHYIIYEGKVLVDDLFTQEMVQKQLDVYQKYHGRPQFAGHQGSWCDCLDDETDYQTPTDVRWNGEATSGCC